MGAQDRVENAKVGLEPPCAAVAERGRDRVDVLDPCPPSGRPRGGAGLADAHGVDIVQPARAQVAQVTGGTGRTDRGDRAAVETDMPIKIKIFVEFEPNVEDEVLHVGRGRSGRDKVCFAPSERCAGASEAGAATGGPVGPGRGGLLHGPFEWAVLGSMIMMMMNHN